VVVDKPTCINLDETEKLIAASREYGGLLATFFNRRWDPDFRLLQQLVVNARVGEIHCLESRVAEPYDGSSTYPGRSRWKLEPPSGGLLRDWGPHLIDQLFELMPRYRPRSLTCYSQRPNRLVAEGLAEQFLIALEGEQLFVLLGATWNATLPPPRWYVVGTQGTIRVNEEATRAEVRSFEGGKVTDGLIPSLPATTYGFADYFLQLLERPDLQRAELERIRRVAYALDLAQRAAEMETTMSWNAPAADLLDI
jgi:predicted dehydrogenase